MPSGRIVFARHLRTNQTSAEELIWNAVRGHRFEGAKFRRQMPLGPYTADSCCMSAKLIIEVDGTQHTRQPGYDSERQRFMESQGFVTLRFTNEDVRGRLQWVMQEIGHMLDLAKAKERSPSPSTLRARPSPRSGPVA